MGKDARELFHEWLDKHENIDFTFEAWAKFLEAHDDFPLFICFLAGMKAVKNNTK